MSLSSPDPLFVVAVTVVAIIVALWTGKIWARRQVTRWGKREGYELVAFRGAWFYEGPRAWFRTEDENAYHVEGARSPWRDADRLCRVRYVVAPIQPEGSG
jgi:hypothetical protein